MPLRVLHTKSYFAQLRQSSPALHFLYLSETISLRNHGETRGNQTGSIQIAKQNTPTLLCICIW